MSRGRVVLPLKAEDIANAKLRAKLGLPPLKEEKQKRAWHPWESIEQENVVAFAWSQRHIYPALRWLYSVPNGDRRDRFTMLNLLKEGLKPGVSDLVLPLPMNGFHGLYMEMKSSRNTRLKKNQGATDEQIEFMNWVASQHYCVCVAIGAEPAKQMLIWYCSGAQGVPPVRLWKVI